MPHTPDRFLRHRTRLTRRAALGRVFNVTRETWRLTDDPSSVRPASERVVSGRTASEAADLAREMASAFARRGFHKPSSSWWGADETWFHRFVVHPGRRGREGALILGSALLGMVAVVVAGRRRAKELGRGGGRKDARRGRDEPSAGR